MHERVTTNGRFAENRRRLIELIYSMEVFSKDDLLSQFREERGCEIAIDGDQTIGEFLTELSVSGALQYRHGEYWVTGR